jgi:DNA-directed RNA polymerase II subunit RPB2
MYKRIGISGFMLGDIFKDYYNKFRVEARKKIDSEYEYKDMYKQESLKDRITFEVFNPSIIGIGLIKSMKGSWGLDQVQGIVQDLNRISYHSFISHLRRLNMPMDTSIKLRKPHQLNASHYGMVCPSESPDGGSIGLLKNLSLLCHISFDVASNIIIKNALEPFADKIKLFGTFGLLNTKGMVSICLNNNWVGIIAEEHVHKMVTWLRLLRRNCLINMFTSISWNIIQKKVHILTDNGRCMRPLFIVKNNAISTVKHKDWKKYISGDTLKPEQFDPYFDNYHDPFELLNVKKNDIDAAMPKLEANSALIEFLDVEETSCSKIAMKLADVANGYYTHCELHPSTMFSIYTLSIPFLNHNAPTRIVFSGAQGKQAIGIYSTNFNHRIDTLGYVLHYPQMPIVKTRFSDYVQATQMPNGENLIVAICTYTGYNQEDSIILNQSSVDRGMFNISYYNCVPDEEEENSNGERIFFCHPDTLVSQGKEIKRKPASYEFLDDLGLPKPGSYIEEGDAVIGKFQTIKSDVQTSDVTYKDKTLVADKTTSGIIDKVVVFKNKDGMKQVKIRMRKYRTPELGDKMASRHGQKGVAGLILPAADMPFTASGLVPDIIINPHAFPSRLTVGHLLESLLNKACIMEGTEYDAMPFEKHNLDVYQDMLGKKFNLNRYGDEIMMNGFTGEQIESAIFICPTYYYRLKHMVGDKINYRTSGRIMGLTKQPTKGRSNEGGLRIGEMETNCIIGHGLSSMLKESFVERSDKYEFYIENGDIAPKNKFRSRVVAPYAFKLMLQEVQSLSIKPHLSIEESNIDDSFIADYYDDESGEENGED